MSDAEKLLDGFQVRDCDLFFTNKRILMKQDFASKNAGLLGLFGGVFAYGIAKAVTSGKRTSYEEMFKNYQGKFDSEILLTDIKKIEVGQLGNLEHYRYFKILSNTDKVWFIHKGTTNSKNFEDRIKKMYPNYTRIKTYHINFRKMPSRA